MYIGWHQVRRHAPPIRGVIHIGAHRAEERPHYLSVGLRNIIWIEADPALAEWLKEHCAEPVFNYAICDQDHTEAILHLANNDGMSSSLLFPKAHIWKHPGIGFSETVRVETITLDTLIAEQSIKIEGFNLINIDIQGAELLALEGMTNTLPHIDAIYAEVNFIEMYAGCGLVGELDARLEEHGFQRRCTYDTKLGWGDALYIRSDSGAGV